MFLDRFLSERRAKDEERQYDALADGKHGWTIDDANWLLQMLESYHGKRLKARLTNMLFHSSWDACSKPENGDFHRGKANGIAVAIRNIEQHANPELYKQEEFPEQQGEAAYIEVPEIAPVL